MPRDIAFGIVKNAGAFLQRAVPLASSASRLQRSRLVRLGYTTIALVCLGSAAPSFAQVVTSVQLTSGVTGTLPFTLGLGFGKGDVPGVPVLSVASSQVIVKSRWSDNSVKHAIASGHMALTAGVPATVNVTAAASAPAGTNLTAADIQAANPSASIQLGSIGTVSLSSLLGTPFRTWISGPEMVEAHYRSTVGSDPTLVVWFHVRLYQNGQVWVRAIAENGFLDVASTAKTYVPAVTVGGATVYNNGGVALTHHAHTRWTAEGWIGTDPQIVPKHNTVYLRATKLVPNYTTQFPPSAATLGGLYQNYVPMQNGNWTPQMGDTGYQAQTGLLGNWDALYVTSGADARAYRSVLANAKALNSYPIVWTDSLTKLATIPSNRATWTISGANGGGATTVGAGTLIWDIAHHGSGGFLAYIITGDYYYLQTMEDQVSLVYLIDSSVHGSGTARVLQGQTRGAAWAQRTIGQLVGIAPADPVVNDYRTLLANLAAHWNGVRQTAGVNPLGYLYDYDLAAYGAGLTAPWQQHYWIQTYGAVSDLEPFADMTVWNAVRDHLYKAAVGILGPVGTNNYCYTKASSYNIKISSGTSSDPTTWYTSWGQVYQNTFGAANTFCGTALEGDSSGIPALAFGYWGRLLPAIAYAVEDNAAGASASWARLTGSSNWSTFINSGFDSVAIWGILPRSVSTDTTTPNPPAALTAQ
jgi:hypothetical protein